MSHESGSGIMRGWHKNHEMSKEQEMSKKQEMSKNQKMSSWDGRLERGAQEFSDHDKDLVERLLGECDPGMCLLFSSCVLLSV